MTEDRDILSRGLARRFIDEIEQDLDLDALRTGSHRIASAQKRSIWRKEVDRFKKSLGKSILTSQYIGSEKKPVWVAAFSTKSKSRIYEHGERILSIAAFSISFDKNYMELDRTLRPIIEISEHAIRRIVQRLGISKDLTYRFNEILEEIQSAINFCGFVNIASMLVFRKATIYPKIPAKNGIFRGIIEKTERGRPIISLRTYIPYEMLDENKNTEADLLDHAFEWYKSIPFYATSSLHDAYIIAFLWATATFFCEHNGITGSISRSFSSKEAGVVNEDLVDLVYEKFIELQELLPSCSIFAELKSQSKSAAAYLEKLISASKATQGSFA
jgi:hypothetical protein